MSVHTLTALALPLQVHLRPPRLLPHLQKLHPSSWACARLTALGHREAHTQALGCLGWAAFWVCLLYLVSILQVRRKSRAQRQEATCS